MSTRSAAVTLVAFSLCLTAACARDPEVAKREFLQSGDQYTAQQKYREAIVEYRNAVQQDPRFGEARQKLADTYAKVGEEKNAAAEYIRAADLLPEDSRAQIQAGLVLLLGRRFEDAQTRAESVLARDPNNVEAQVLRGNALAGLKRIDDGIRDVEEAIRLNPERADSYSTLAGMQMAAGRAQEAKAAFEAAVQRSPRSATARLALANFYWMSGDRARTEAQLTEAVAVLPRDALANRALAAFFASTGQLERAEPYLKVLADVAPAAQGKVLLGDFYGLTRRTDEALKVYRSVQEVNTESFMLAQLRVAELLVQSQNVEAANGIVDAVLAKFPRQPEVLLAKAQLLTSERQFDEALKWAQQAVDLNPQSAPGQFAVGKIQAFRNHSEEAIAAFNEVAKLNPRLIAVDVELARLHLRQGRLEQAGLAASAALRKAPAHVEAQLLLARADLLAGKVEAAEKSLVEAASHLSDSPAVNTELGIVRIQQGNFAAARTALNKALDAEPHYADAVNALVQLDLSAKRADAARTRVESALKARPDDPSLLFVAAQMHSALRDNALAEKALRRIIQIEPNNLRAYESLGLLFASERRTDDAIAEFRQVAAREPKNIGARTVIAIMLALQRKSAEAKSAYEDVIRIDPTAAVAANNLAWMYASAGEKLDEALTLAQTAKSALPQSADVADTLGWVYFKKGLHGQAVPFFREAAELQPKNAVFQYHLGLAYSQTGEFGMARRAMEATIKLAPASTEAAEARQALTRLAAVGS